MNKERKGPILELITHNSFSKGCGACAGCGSQLALKHVLSELLKVKKEVIITFPAGCNTITVGGRYPCFIGQDIFSAWLAIFASAAPEAVGIADALRLRKRYNAISVAFCGDGASYDIGFGQLSAAADRNDDLLYILNDNEAYMNTGVQCSGATPIGAFTTTTPDGAERMLPNIKKDIDAIMRAHEIPYVATATIGSLPMVKDFHKKLKRAANINGFRFLHLLNPCPPGWKFDAELTARISELAVETRFFPLFEYENGKLTLTYKPKKVVPVEEYFKLQGRFDFQPEEIAQVQELVNQNYARLEKFAKD